MSAIGAPLLEIPYELLDQLFRDLTPFALNALALTCKQLFDIIIPPLMQEFTQVTTLEDILIKKMQALSLKDTIVVPKTKNKFNARTHAEIVIPLYSEVFTIAYDRVRSFVFSTSDDKEKALFCNPVCSTLLADLHTVMPATQDTDGERRTKSSQRFQVVERLLRNKMKTLVQFIVESEMDMLSRLVIEKKPRAISTI